MSEWRTIDTAPSKDGAWADLWCINPHTGAGGRHTNMRWDAFTRRWRSDAGDRLPGDCYATHWMPLPEPPGKET